uniref:Uncharacterized protein n=1 Tax=Ciona intestinalis TaxID=7719 RepID=H2XYG0_CIOIN
MFYFCCWRVTLSRTNFLASRTFHYFRCLVFSVHTFVCKATLPSGGSGSSV